MRGIFLLQCWVRLHFERQLFGWGSFWITCLLAKCRGSPFLYSSLKCFALVLNSVSLLRHSLHLWISKHIPKRQPPQSKSENWRMTWFAQNLPAFLFLTCICMPPKATLCWWYWLFSLRHTQAVNKRTVGKMPFSGKTKPHLSAPI